ncbi:hypothetical protein C7R88_13250 [Plesiomonas shigelloides]|uniref:hypothetical protein n=1 Tax=Plesiomonas shigelloides TaxID=703 RepID=UPI000D12E344|nr:hypothetical protein [Plesiomonas shigelloides]AVQ88161.1 hypothetical protein C7R88_13250 [Plesiomonas shigelloides]
MNNKLSSNQIAYLNRAMTDGKGLIEIGELARGLGKQKGNVIRKLESNFPPEQLFKMKNRLVIPNGGNGAKREVETYMLDYRTAGALAMSYDLRLGIEVLTILEDSLKTIQEMALAAAKDDTSGVRKAVVSFRERHRERLEFRPGASENEDRSVALRRLGRKGL